MLHTSYGHGSKNGPVGNGRFLPAYEHTVPQTACPPVCCRLAETGTPLIDPGIKQAVDVSPRPNTGQSKQLYPVMLSFACGHVGSGVALRVDVCSFQMLLTLDGYIRALRPGRVSVRALWACQQPPCAVTEQEAALTTHVSRVLLGSTPRLTCPMSSNEKTQQWASRSQDK